MDNQSEVREFLTSPRARLTPEQAGSNQRVPGLRRGEVAMLVGAIAAPRDGDQRMIEDGWYEPVSLEDYAAASKE